MFSIYCLSHYFLCIRDFFLNVDQITPLADSLLRNVYFPFKFSTGSLPWCLLYTQCLTNSWWVKWNAMELSEISIKSIILTVLK